MKNTFCPKTNLARSLCRHAGFDPDKLVEGSYNEKGDYFPYFHDNHLCDHSVGYHQEVFFWRKFVSQAAAIISDLACAGHVIMQRRPNTYHGEKEEATIYVVSFRTQVIVYFNPSVPWKIADEDGAGYRCQIAVRARSNAEAVEKLFNEFEVEPEAIEVLSVEMMSGDWDASGSGFEMEGDVLEGRLVEVGEILNSAAKKDETAREMS